MKILWVKTSSLGDVLQAFPAVTDLAGDGHHEIHWLVEPAFADLVVCHRHVKKVWTVPWRSYRLIHTLSWLKKIKSLAKQLQAEHFDAVLDGQGLLKSAYMARLAKAPTYGWGWRGCREPLASYLYHNRLPGDFHSAKALTRMRNLVASFLGQSVSESCHYHLDPPSADLIPTPAIWFIPSTTWSTKMWTVSHWQQLKEMLLGQYHYPICIHAHGDAEYATGLAIAEDNSRVSVVRSKSLQTLIGHLATAKLVVGVDTGPSYLAMAMNTPTVFLFGPTDWRRYLDPLPHIRMVHAGVGLSCQPCQRKQCRWPLVRDQNGLAPCMLALSANQVLDQIKHLIS